MPAMIWAVPGCAQPAFAAVADDDQHGVLPGDRCGHRCGIEHIALHHPVRRVVAASG